MSTRRIFTTIATVLGLGAATLVAGLNLNAQQARDQFQAPKSGTASISGVILTDETTPQPIKRAQVMVINPDAQFTKTVYTNEAGKFSLTGLPAGSYTLNVNKTPYLRTAYGAKRWDRPGTQIRLKEGAAMNDITMRLQRGGVLGGIIMDENGQPAFGVSVRVMQVRMQNGERTFVSTGVGNALSEMTDDRGMYRIYGLPPGDYVVSATPRLFTGEVRAMTDSEIRAVMQALQQQQQQAAAQQANPALATAPKPTPTPTPTDTVTVGYANVYYPGTTAPAMASSVTLAAGEERLGIDFPMKLVRTARLEGTVLVPPNVRPQTVQLMLAPATAGTQPGGAGMELLTINRASPDAEGKFSFTAVPPGQYQIVARATAGAPGGPPPPPPPPPPPGGLSGATMTFTSGVRIGGGAGAPEVMEMMMMPGGGGDPNGAVFWGQTDISVDGTALSGLTVALQPGMTITGRVAFKGTRLTPEADLSRVRLNLSPVQAPGGGTRLTMGMPGVQVEPNGQFRITGVTPGRYRFSGVVPLSPGSAPGVNWALASAMVKGQDTLDFQLDIGPNDEIKDVVVTFTDATQEINGTLQDVSGRPAPDYTIVVFADDKRYWTTPSRRIRSARPGTDGKYAIAGLPPGEYRIAALTDVAPGEINDPSFLEQIVSASVKVTIAEGEKKTQDLRIAGGL